MSAPTEEKGAAGTEDNQRVGCKCGCVGLMGESGAVLTRRTGWKLTLMSGRGAAPNKGRGDRKGRSREGQLERRGLGGAKSRPVALKNGVRSGGP